MGPGLSSSGPARGGTQSGVEGPLHYKVVGVEVVGVEVMGDGGEDRQ